MRLLLDTCTFLWLVLESPQLSSGAEERFRDPDNETFLSAVSVWEIVLKYDLGRLPLPEKPLDLISRYRRQLQVESLPLKEAEVLGVSRLPAIHRDPFDRMLISQAIAEGMTILTPDEDIRRYPVMTTW
ncbi:MAG: type II toxin-antitoxin system VapC family toxin [Candidatus Binataceae bacterium]